LVTPDPAHARSAVVTRTAPGHYPRFMSGAFQVICQVESATRSDLMHVRHQIGVVRKVATWYLIPDIHLRQAAWVDGGA